jgi:hypothetical protein
MITEGSRQKRQSLSDPAFALLKLNDRIEHRPRLRRPVSGHRRQKLFDNQIAITSKYHEHQTLKGGVHEEEHQAATVESCTAFPQW